MSVTIEILGSEATVEDGEWEGDDESLVEILQLFTPDGRPGPSEPSVDWWIAQQVIDALGTGEIVEIDEEQDDDPEGTIY